MSIKATSFYLAQVSQIMSLDWASEQVKRLYLYLRRLCERYGSYLQEVCDESEAVYVCSTLGIADIHSACNKNRHTV